MVDVIEEIIIPHLRRVTEPQLVDAISAKLAEYIKLKSRIEELQKSTHGRKIPDAYDPNKYSYEEEEGICKFTIDLKELKKSRHRTGASAGENHCLRGSAHQGAHHRSRGSRGIHPDRKTYIQEKYVNFRKMSLKSLKNGLKIATVTGLAALVLGMSPQKTNADDFIVNGKIENVINREPLSEGVLKIDDEIIPINPDGTFSALYDGDANLEYSQTGYNIINREINGNYGVGSNDSLIIQEFPEGDFENSLFEIFNYMKFLGLPGGVWNRNWGFFEDPEYLCPIWFDPDFNNNYAYSLEYPDSTYSFMEVAKGVFLEPTRPDSMFGHHIQDSNYPWHYEVPDSITSTTNKGVNFILSYRNYTDRNGNLVNIEIAYWNINVEALSQALKHEWMAHGVYFNDIPSGNPYNPSTICGAGLNYDFSDEDLDVLAIAHNLANGTDFDWYGDVVVGIPPLQRHPLAGTEIRFRNSPNPFNSITTLRYSVDKPDNYNLVVYDINGRKVKSVFDTFLTPGNYSTVFDGSDLSSGIYIARIMDDKGNFDVKRMSLVK